MKSDSIADAYGPRLARANLLRMRGQWTEAANECVEVLRLDPTNATAHSLLGDIYQDQGRPGDARHWYQLALEMNPGSEADRAKLARADETLEARRQRAEWEAVLEGRSQPVATSLLVRESLQRIAALAGAAVCGIVLVMATLVSVSDRTQAGPVDEPRRTSLPRVSAPVPIAAETSRERELAMKTQERAAGGPGQVIRVELDPRTHAASVRLFLPRHVRERLDSTGFRLLVMREGYRAARALHEADRSLALIHVYVMGPAVLPGGRSDTERLFLGTLAAEDLMVEPEKVTPQELEKFFGDTARPVWTPELNRLEAPAAAGRQQTAIPVWPVSTIR